MEKKEREKKVFIEDFKGNKLFSIWAVDNEGEKVGDYPVLSFGKAKARAIVEHIEELKTFLEG